MQLIKRFFLALILAMPSLAQAAIDPGVQQRLAALSVPFVPNAGQWDERAAFAAQTFAGTLFVTKEGKLVYRLPGKAAAQSDRLRASPVPSDSRRAGPPRLREPEAERAGRPGWVLTESLIDANGQAPVAAPAGSHLQVGKVSYAIGNDDSKHRDGLPTYERVNLGDVYPGINVQLRATGTNVEKIFTVAPGSDPGAIQVRLDGAQQLELGANGELIAHTGNGPLTYTAPIAYQEDSTGNRSDVLVRYALTSVKDSYRFAVGTYDASRPLVIDPLLQSTYLGGSGGDKAYAMAIHPSTGEVYVAGQTTSIDFPKVAGAEQAVKGNFSDAFVTRLNASLTTRLQSTYLGGSADEQATALAIHPTTGEVYVAGYTASTDFPNVAGAEQAVKGTGIDGFVTRLNATLTTRLQSTYLGGSGDDIALALAIHPVTGEVYVAGQTTSTDFPKVASAEQATKGTGTNNDGFVSRLNATLTTRLQSTYLGGNNEDSAQALAIHPVTGEVYVAGYTASSDFPKVAGADQAAKGAGYDAFVTRLNAALSNRLQSTYLGGNGDDAAWALAIHPATGEVYVAGYTSSTDFPKVAGAEQTAHAADPGVTDAFVTRLNASLTTRLQSTYLGGNGAETALALAIHPSTGEVYVAGYTTSTDFPKVAGAEQAVKGTIEDGFVTRLNTALTTRSQSTYLGGNSTDYAQALAIHPVSGEVYVAGFTMSTDFPKVAGAEQTTAGGVDAFVSRYAPDLTLNDNTPDAFAFVSQSNVPLQSVRTSNPAHITGIFGGANIYVDGQLGSSYCVSSVSGCSCDISGGFVNAPGTVGNNAYVCVRHTSSVAINQVTRTDLHVGGAMASFIVTTGTLIGGSCTLDVDGNNAINALTDGLIILRAMFGLTGTSVTDGAIGGGASRGDWTTIRAYLNGNCGTSFAP